MSSTIHQFATTSAFWRPERLVASAWLEHAPIAFWLIETLEPRVFVELGTESGFSYCAFCQAVDRLGLPSRGFAVDTWQGDEHTGAYGEEVFADLSTYHDSRYLGFSSLLRSTFDDAVSHFEDSSIDLLHIDGCHRYESARHDYDTWRPKLSPNAVVLFHDTNVRERDFGVHELWAELRRDYDGFEFVHGGGLGVLGVGTELPPAITALLRADDATTAEVRAMFAHLGRSVRGEHELLQAERALEDRATKESTLEHEIGRLQTMLVRSTSAPVRVTGAERAARERVEQLEEDLAALRSSTSWRVTKPIRFAGSRKRALSAHLPSAGEALRRPFRAPASDDQTSITGAGPRSVQRPAVVLVSGEPKTPGHTYRVSNLGSALPRQHFHTTILALDEIDDRVAEVTNANVVWIWRAPWSRKLASLIETAKGNGAKIVFDADDLLICPELARSEVIDGIRTQRFSERDVRDRFASFRRVAAEAHACTAPTTSLARHFRRLAKPTTVIPNGFDAATLRRARAGSRSRSGSDGLVRIGYAAGSFTHQRDFAVASHGLACVLREHQNARFVTFEGTVDLSEFPELEAHASQIECRPLVALESLPDEYSRFDVSIIPLEVGNPFCEAKSELKFFESALAGAATVASPTEPLAAAIRHGHTGLLATDADSWYRQLSVLVEDAELRRRLAELAYDDVLWSFGPERRALLVTRFVNGLVSSPAMASELTRSALTEDSEGPASVEPLTAEFEILFESPRRAESRIAVVIPLFNYAQYIEAALDSVRRQTRREIDVVVVDDRSTDDSAAVARAWLERHATDFNRVALLRNKRNSQLARTRNTGIKYADTELFLPLDPDNLLLPHCLDATLRLLDESGAAAVFPTIATFGETEGGLLATDWDPVLLRHGNYFDAMALVRRACWLSVGGYEALDVPGWEDFDLWCKFAERGLYAARLPQTAARYRVHSDSMLRTTTEAVDRKPRLLAQMKERHPWLDLDEPVTHPEVRVASLAATAEPADPRPLEELRAILRCPITRERLDVHGNELVSVTTKRPWPIVEGRPVFTPAGTGVVQHPATHLSNPLSEEAVELIRESGDGLVLNLSAGGTDTRFKNVIEAEYAIFRHTDVVVDVHELPFADDLFTAVVAFNAFEHYRDPKLAMKEVHRVLRPGGKLLLRTAFLQPMHEEPHHFYNCTKYGLEQWLEDFEVEAIAVSPNFHPLYALGWLASELESGYAEVSARTAERFRGARLEEFVTFWRDRASHADEPSNSEFWDRFSSLPVRAQETSAAGWQALARKPG
ncbi:MAG TPA: class I SAM-dependent methyltransferase [Gaiellaceae bacterium]|jgi:SAM-dependent methyltransferase/glycosyltransferase involved in cell wall biosynthesis